MTQPAQPEWRNSDPLSDLVDRKRANIVILRPDVHGDRMEAGIGICEMKHGWHVTVMFGAERRVIETWDPSWFWVLAPMLR
jgi:hypothetical protein